MQPGGMRVRGQKAQLPVYDGEDPAAPTLAAVPSPPTTLSAWNVLSKVLFTVLCCMVLEVCFDAMPSEADAINRLKPTGFDLMACREHLKELTNLGPRLVGSPANEKMTPQLIQRALRKVTPKAGCRLEVEVQRPSGSFVHEGFLGGFVSGLCNLCLPHTT